MPHPSKHGAQIVSKTVIVNGRSQDLALEGIYWDGLDAIAGREGKPLTDILALVDARRHGEPLEDALRGFMNRYNRTMAGAARPGVAEVAPSPGFLDEVLTIFDAR
ncbi:MAG TPA: ribbon-helix-helix domain-containing protein [Azospirillaceae bacterium]|nr:ribbon-helix-helix domain-containing protein [Azospirillaceae bacterium]